MQIAALYAAGAMSWILVTDLGLAWWMGTLGNEALASVMKGSIFVIGTSFLLHQLVRVLFGRALRAEKERLQIERKAAEDLQRTQRMYATLARANEVATGATDRVRLSNEICRALVERAGMKLAFVGWMGDHDSRLTPEASAGPEVDYLQGVVISTDPSGPDASGPSCSCARSGAPVVIQDILAMETRAPWRDRALKRGFRSCTSVPLRDRWGARGVLSMYSGEAGFFTESVVQLAEQLARDFEHGLRVLAVHRELKDRNTELVESEGRYRSLFENNHAVMLIMDPADGSIVDANPAATRFYGWDRDQLRRMKITDISRSAADTTLDYVGQAMRGERNVFSCVHLTANGATREVEAFAGLLELRGRSVLYAIVHDVTERKALEQQLIRAQRMEGIGLLAGGIAHDLNNVLQPIVLSVELLRSQVRGKTVESTLDVIASSAKRGSAVVRQVLTFARGIEGERTPVRPKDLMRELVAMLAETLPRTITIQRKIGEDVPAVLADPNQLHQVLLNLALNARDAMPEGGTLAFCVSRRRVHKSLASELGELKAGDYVEFSVSDTGEGIKPEDRPHIFDPFFTTKPIGQGTGLGLPSVLGIVRNHEGLVEFDSTPGAGSVFRILLPALSIEEAAKHVQTTMPALDGRGRLVLVCDDEAAVRRVTSAVLRQFGFEVREVAEGRTAIEVFRENPDTFALAVIDVMMPDLGGDKAVRELRRIRPEFPVLFMSGLMDRGTLLHENFPGGSAGMRFLHKPFGAVELICALQELLDAAPLRADQA